MRKARVSRHVELGVGSGAGNRKVLQHVAEIRKAGALKLVSADLQDRGGFVDRVAADARAGDDDFVYRCFLRHFGRLGLGASADKQQQCGRSRRLRLEFG